MASWRRHTRQHPQAPNAWIIREFAMRGLAPPYCTPEALAHALERERQITIAFRPHASDNPGVYGMLPRQVEYEDTYIIMFRPTQNIALRRLILFHELAHLLFEHPLKEVAGGGVLRGYMVSDEDDAVAEAFAVGAMHYSFVDAAESTPPANAEDDGAASAFGQFLQRTQYRP